MGNIGTLCGSKKGINIRSRDLQQRTQLIQLIPELNTDELNKLMDQWEKSFIQYFKRTFYRFANENLLDIKNFYRIFPELKKFPKSIKQKIFQIFDTQNRGKIDFREFCQSLSLCCNSNITQKIKFLFLLFDNDNDNYLSRSEIVTFIKYTKLYIKGIDQQQQQQQNANLNKEQEQEIIDQLFQKKENKISFQTFQKWAIENFNIQSFFLIFEIIPDPFVEREIIRQIVKEQQEKKLTDNNEIQNKEEQQIITCEAFYIVSWKWWFKWRYYVNYAYKKKYKTTQQNNEKNSNKNEIENQIINNHQQKDQSQNNQIINNQQQKEEETALEHQIQKKEPSISKNSLIDFEFNNQIPSERYNEQHMEYNLEPNAFKNNIAFMTQKNLQESMQQFSHNEKNSLQQKNQARGEEDIISDDIVLENNSHKKKNNYHNNPLEGIIKNVTHNNKFQQNLSNEINPSGNIFNENIQQNILCWEYNNEEKSQQQKQIDQQNQLENGQKIMNISDLQYLESSNINNNQNNIATDNIFNQKHNENNFNNLEKSPEFPNNVSNNYTPAVSPFSPHTLKNEQAFQPKKLSGQYQIDTQLPIPNSVHKLSPNNQSKGLSIDILFDKDEKQKETSNIINYQDFGGHNLGDRPPQIDNSDIQGEYEQELQKNILLNHDYVVIPKNAWEKLQIWYGGGPKFKRKQIYDPKRNIKTLELYPPVIQGYVVKNNGDIDYDSLHEIMISNWKQIQDLVKKFQKNQKFKKIDAIYYKKLGTKFEKETNMEKKLIDLQIESGTIFIFMNKQNESKFLQKQLKNDLENNQNENYNYEIGDQLYINHPAERRRKTGYIYQIKNNLIKIHFKKESFKNDICFERQQLYNYIQKEHSQIITSIEQITKQINGYNPKIIGLANLGNTCFINCVIQCLVYTPFFRQYLLDEGFSDILKEKKKQITNNSQLFNSNTTNINNNNASNVNNQNEYSLISELSKLTKVLYEKPYNDVYNPVQPQNLKKAIDLIMPQFSGYEQQDAQEFLQGLLDNLNEEIKQTKVIWKQAKSLAQNTTTDNTKSKNQDITKNTNTVDNNKTDSNKINTNTIDNNVNNKKEENINEGKEIQENSVIKDVFMGQTINTIVCSVCNNVNYKYEDFFTISLPLPISQEFFYEVTYIPRVNQDIVPPIIKYGIKVKQNATLGDFFKEFEKQSGISTQKLIFFEVYQHNLHQIFDNKKITVPIRNLGIRSHDQIAAFEILQHFQQIEDERNSLLPKNLYDDEKSMNQGDFVDILLQNDVWVHAKIEDMTIKECQNQMKKIQYKIRIQNEEGKPSQKCDYVIGDGQRIQSFRSKICMYPGNIVYPIPIVNRRCKNKVMEKFGLPFCLLVPMWLTWKEFHLLVYNQIKRCIDFDYLKKKQKNNKQQSNQKVVQKGYQKLNEFVNIENEQHQINQIQLQQYHKSHTNTNIAHEELQQQYGQFSAINNNQDDSITKNQQHDQFPNSPIPKAKKSKKTNRNDMINSKEYYKSISEQVTNSVQFLQTEYFPYKLRLMDYNTEKCAICELPMAYSDFQFQYKDFCKGCEPGLVNVPLLWLLKSQELKIAIDWKDSLSFKLQSMVPQIHKSFQELKKQKNENKKGIPIENCFNLYSKQEKVELKCDKCNTNQIQSTKLQIHKLPNILILHLSRFQFQNGLFEKIDELVNYPLKKLKLNEWLHNHNLLDDQNQIEDQYDLFSVINHIGNGNGGHYTSYVKLEDNNTWVNFDDENAQYIQENNVVSNKGYILFYKKSFPTSAIINLTYKNL